MTESQLDSLPDAPEPTSHLPATMGPGERAAPEDPQTKTDNKDRM